MSTLSAVSQRAAQKDRLAFQTTPLKAFLGAFLCSKSFFFHSKLYFWFLFYLFFSVSDFPRGITIHKVTMHQISGNEREVVRQSRWWTRSASERFRVFTTSTTKYKQNGGRWSKTSRVFAALSLFSGSFESSTLGKGKIVCHSYHCEDRDFK